MPERRHMAFCISGELAAQFKKKSLTLTAAMRSGPERYEMTCSRISVVKRAFEAAGVARLITEQHCLQVRF